MMLIVEGPDASGKSTLCAHLAKHLGLIIQASEGPPNHTGEMDDRLRRYAHYGPEYMFDRHPVVSNTIYDMFRPIMSRGAVDPERIEQLYGRKPLFIYCHPLKKMEHVVKRTDSKEHLSMLERNELAIHEAYVAWAQRHAQIWYRIGDDMDNVVRMVRGARP